MTYQTITKFCSFRGELTSDQQKQRADLARQIKRWIEHIRAEDTRDALELIIFYRATMSEAVSEARNPEATAQHVIEKLNGLKCL